MPKFRKKPVVIDAFQFLNESGYPSWFSWMITKGTVYYQGGDNPYFTIETLEGKMKANLGDWIIQGVNGEVYPCKPDIFEKTYESE